MKYGYYVRTVHTYQEIVDLTVQVEKLGFESAHVNDHLIGFDEKKEKKEPYLESMLLMTALATQTTQIKLGHIVLCNSFRNPAYLAKMISTLDNISNGRALLWLGAGWYEEEYKAYGYPFPSAKQRVDELEESLQIYKKLFTEEVTNFDGKFWKLENTKNFPKPIQKPYPQIVLGTTGKRMMKIACKEANGVNLPYVELEKLHKHIKEIRMNLGQNNREEENFEISLFTSITVTETQEELDTLVSKIVEKSPKEKKLTQEEVLRNQFIGFPEDIKNKIKQVEEIGINKMVIAVRKSKTIEDPLKLFCDKIM
ncbi:MAG: LLM class flavin-dependent oxidoreductase [Candidatus Heimdallarchaeaceae archaeon]